MHGWVNNRQHDAIDSTLFRPRLFTFLILIPFKLEFSACHSAMFQIKKKIKKINIVHKLLESLTQEG